MIFAEETATPFITESGPAQTRLIELYTSEGCSSCPPAEAFLSSLKDDPRLWKQFFPIAMHVTYWDQLGWPDRFAAPQFTQRQSEYARNWGARGVYTPGFVINGKEWRGFFQRQPIPPARSANIGILRLEETGGKEMKADEFGRTETQKLFRIVFQPSNAKALGSAQKLDGNVAIVGSGLATQVRAGENKGRRLDHDFVALEMKGLTLTRKDDGTYVGSVTLPISQKRKTRLAVVAWVSRLGELAPLQTTGGWLSKSG